MSFDYKEFEKCAKWLHGFCYRMEESGLPNIPSDDREGLLSVKNQLLNAVVAMDSKNSCDKCSDVDLLVGFKFDDGGGLDIRFDVDNAEIDITSLTNGIDHSIQINYCPFCGKKLSGRESKC